MGTRLPTGVPTHTPDNQRHRQRTRHRAHRNGDGESAHGHQAQPRHCGGKGIHEFLQPSQPLLRGTLQRQRHRQADNKVHQTASRTKRHHLLSLTQKGGGTCRNTEDQRHQGGTLPRRTRHGDAQQDPGGVPRRATRRHRCHHSLRHGHRQTRRALRHPLRHTEVARRILPGDRTRRTRRRRRCLHCLLLP